MQWGASDLEVADGLCSVTRTLTHEELLDDEVSEAVHAFLRDLGVASRSFPGFEHHRLC